MREETSSCSAEENRSDFYTPRASDRLPEGAYGGMTAVVGRHMGVSVGGSNMKPKGIATLYVSAGRSKAASPQVCGALSRRSESGSGSVVERTVKGNAWTAHGQMGT